MAISRYRSVNKLDNKFYETVEFPSADVLSNITAVQVRVSKFDRLDNLAFKYLGSGEYWWIIAVMNDLNSAFDLEDGQVLRIPTDLQEIMKLF